VTEQRLTASTKSTVYSLHSREQSHPLAIRCCTWPRKPTPRCRLSRMTSRGVICISPYKHAISVTGCGASRGQAAVRSRRRTCIRIRTVGRLCATRLCSGCSSRGMPHHSAALRLCHGIVGGACAAVTHGSNKHCLLEGGGNNSYTHDWSGGVVVYCSSVGR
jgi:hypothetical protein